MRRKCFHFEACRWRQLREKREVMREDRNMELSVRGKKAVMEGWWRGCEDGKGKLRRGVSDGAQRSKGREEDESEKGEDGRKNLPQWIELLADLCGVVSLYINHRRWGNSTNAMPMGLCVCVPFYLYSCIAPHFCSPSSCRSCLLQSKLTSEFDRTRLPVVR